MTMLEPSGDVAALMSREWLTPRPRARVGSESKPKRNTLAPGSVGEERQIETASIPGDQNSGCELGQEHVEFDQELAFGPVEDPSPTRAAHGNGNNGGDLRVEAIE